MILMEDFFIIGTGILLLSIIISLCFKLKITKLFFYNSFLIYIIIVLAITLCPIPYEQAEFIYPVPNNFIPFKTIVSTLKFGITLTAFVQIFGNILISVPYGIFLGIMNNTRKHKHSTIILLLLTLLFPLVVELLQFFIGIVIYIFFNNKIV